MENLILGSKSYLKGVFKFQKKKFNKLSVLIKHSQIQALFASSLAGVLDIFWQIFFVPSTLEQPPYLDRLMPGLLKLGTAPKLNSSFKEVLSSFLEVSHFQFFSLGSQIRKDWFSINI